MTTSNAGEGEGARGRAVTLKGLAPLALVLVVPFLLRPRDNLLDASGESIVILSPNSEPTRYEFARAFREHMREKGRSVWIDWRTPGSSREIVRFIASEYSMAFENHWKRRLERPWSGRVAAAFADPKLTIDGDPRSDDEARSARRAFLDSEVGIGIDLLFGTGSAEAAVQASAGRLVDAGLLRSHPDWFGEGGIPERAGGKVMWDHEGRWVGSCLTLFGLCHNRDALRRLGMKKAPDQWSDLADPAYFGQLALADPSKSGAAASAFEMLIHQQMNLAAEERAGRAGPLTDADEMVARSEGWARAMRLVRRIAANARYFSSAGTQPTLDIAMGDAAAGMCIDFYGRSQSETRGGGAGRLGFVTPHGGTAVDTDPIGLFRGAPHRELAVAFMEFVLSPEGQKLWNFRVGTPGGPVRYALRRLPILPALYAPSEAARRSDPGENPYDEARAFVYHPVWTGPLVRAITFIVRVTCLDAHEELAAAYRDLFRAGFPPRASSLFEDVALIDYPSALGSIRAAVTSGNPVDEAELGNRFVSAARAQYRDVSKLARAGQ
jgi:ABC-type Fe3+ transport system substrate-binding protein